MAEDFVPVLDIAEILEGKSRRCLFEGKDVALFNVEGRIYATQDECTHGRAALSDGYLIGEEVECPLHQGIFNVRTGAVIAPPCTQPLRIYDVLVKDGLIYLAAPKTNS